MTSTKTDTVRTWLGSQRGLYTRDGSNHGKRRRVRRRRQVMDGCGIARMGHGEGKERCRRARVTEGERWLMVMFVIVGTLATVRPEGRGRGSQLDRCQGRGCCCGGWGYRVSGARHRCRGYWLPHGLSDARGRRWWQVLRRDCVSQDVAPSCPFVKVLTVTLDLGAFGPCLRGNWRMMPWLLALTPGAVGVVPER